MLFSKPAKTLRGFFKLNSSNSCYLEKCPESFRLCGELFTLQDLTPWAKKCISSSRQRPVLLALTCPSAPLRKLHKENGRRHCWLQKLMTNSDRSHFLYRYTSSGWLLVFPGICSYVRNKRESTCHTHVDLLASAIPRCLQMPPVA